MAEELRTVAHRLYGLRPDRFTAARTAAEKAARDDGDKELAAAIKALRRPAVAAWAVNILVRRRGELVEQVVELGDQLRQAQSLLQGDALRELTRQRRQLVTAVASEARSSAADLGQHLSEAAVRQVEETLQAAMTDREAAEAVRSGLLAQPLSSTGLASLAEVLAVPLEQGGPPQDPSGSAARPSLSVVRDADRALEDAQARVEAAGASVRAAQKASDKAVKKRGKAEARVLQLEAELEELRRRVAELEEQSDAAVERLSDLDSAVEESAATLEDARAEADAAESALAALD